MQLLLKRKSHSTGTERRTKHVALILESQQMPRRQMLTGVAQYIQEHQPWALYLKPEQVSHALGDWLRDWDGDGIIAAIHEQNSDLFSELRIPVVDIAGTILGIKAPLVHANDHAIGRKGAEHLIERGFTNFAFCVRRQLRWSEQRLEGFTEAVRERGHSPSVYEFKRTPDTGGPHAWMRQQQALVDWIKELPKPVAVMTSGDLMGQQFLEACMRTGIRVPEEVAVVGADDDKTICSVCSPPLSSVIINDHQRGYEAAALLDRMMAGEAPPKEPILIEPSGIACRASTDILAIQDEAVVTVLRYIRQNACLGINVGDASKKVPVSRRVLERRFSRLVGRSMHQEITRMRLNHAVELLTGTQLELKVIAHKAGFGSQAYMTAVFRSELGCTPGSYRAPRKRVQSIKTM